MVLAPKRPIAKKGCCEGTTTIGVDEEQELRQGCTALRDFVAMGHGSISRIEFVQESEFKIIENPKPLNPKTLNP